VNAYDSIIRNLTDVVPLTPQQVDWFVSMLEPVTCKRKEFVLMAGDVCRYETFVNTGCLKVFYTDLQGVEHTVKFAIENWWALDLESFEMQSPAFYSIQALETTDCFQISKANHDLLYASIPALEKFARMRYQNSYILLQHRMTQNLFATAETKYDAFVKKYPGLEQRIPQKEIASYLGITPEFLSMLRRKRMNAAIS